MQYRSDRRRLAAFVAHASTGPLPWLVAASATILTLSALIGPSMSHAGHGSSHIAVNGSLSPDLGFGDNAVGQMTFDWLLMVLAMMLPLVSSQVAFARDSVARRWKFAATLWFLSGYVGTWTLFGVILLPTATIFSAVGSTSFGLLLWLCFSIAWSATPLAQFARNLCHKQLRVGAFGYKTVVDSFLYGARIGGYCFLSCWPWMILPLFIADHHMLAMVGVTLYMFADRISIPAAVKWRTPPALHVLLGR